MSFFCFGDSLTFLSAIGSAFDGPKLQAGTPPASTWPYLAIFFMGELSTPKLMASGQLSAVGYDECSSDFDFRYVCVVSTV